MTTRIPPQAMRSTSPRRRRPPKPDRSRAEHVPCRNWWAADSTIKNRVVLVTCEYEYGDTGVNNIVIAADLTTS